VHYLGPDPGPVDVPHEVRHPSLVVVGVHLGDNVIRRINPLSHIRLQLVDPLCRRPDALAQPSITN
jgi:hypothetical protein